MCVVITSLVRDMLNITGSQLFACGTQRQPFKLTDRVAGLPTNFDTSQLEASFHIGDADLNEDCLPEADAYDYNSDADDADDFDEFE